MSERKSVLLRLDPAVHDALASWAADELRSTNAQIEFLLRRALAASRASRESSSRARRAKAARRCPSRLHTATSLSGRTAATAHS